MTRSGIRGFAAGLLVAALICGGYYYLNEPKPVKDEALSLAELQKASEKLGYNLVEKPSVKETLLAKPVTYKLVIKKGMSSEDIGELLKKNKIIKDTSHFARYLQQHQLTTKLQIGEYLLKDTMSTDQIADMITE